MKPDEKGYLGFVRRSSEVINKFISVLCLIFMSGMTFVVLLGVFFRYVLRMPLSWPEELSRYMMIWAASLAVSIGVQEKGHVGLTFLFDITKSRTIKIILESVIFLATCGFLAIMIYYSVLMVMNAKSQISQGLGITMVLPTLAIPVSMVVALIQLVLRYVLDVSSPGDIQLEKEVIDI